ncbi:heavy metal-associated isoprenylated plant protein 16-like [Ipomoea triloba]|uniref:heavy metal-associated isoprenylated plant protein 16-like n=1 Tax=Ipomoea triloba TaxID=35885 RepID=UPI00125D83D9|nr:heavy metal-associated isoprenylated plant protein 16-like [Ipomoea triloba]
MKQKIVVRIPNLNAEKIRAKAMKIVAKLEGVGSITVQGESMEEIMVIGEVDAVEMTNRLRKKLGSAELISVDKVVSEETSTADNNSSSSVVEEVPQPEWFSPYYSSYYPQYLPCYSLY